VQSIGEVQLESSERPHTAETNLRRYGTSNEVPVFDVASECSKPEGLHDDRLCHSAARPHYADLHADLPFDRSHSSAGVCPQTSVGRKVCLFLNRQRGFRIPSSAAFGQIGEAYVAAIHSWAEAEGIPVRYFAKGENKEVGFTRFGGSGTGLVSLVGSDGHQEALAEQVEVGSAEHHAFEHLYIGWVPDPGSRAATGGSSCRLHCLMSP
jgi:hypothetical protein